MLKKRTILDQVEDILTPSRRITTQPLNILIVGPEVAPYASVGGVSRVLAHLAKAFIQTGHDARVFMPKFGSVDEDKYDLKMLHEGLKVPTSGDKKPYLVCNVKVHQAKGHAPVYFLENREYYELRANVYGYADDPVRWALLSRATLEFLRCCSDWQPDVIHANDWQTGAIPNYMKTVYKGNEISGDIASIYTIHNLNYQGMFDHKNISDLDFDDGKSEIAGLFDERLLKQNFMRRGIMYADIVNTVSPTYAREIRRPEYGEGLDRLLTEVRSKVFGVLNGIDYEEFDPGTDKLIEETFDLHTLVKREESKKALQQEFDLKDNLEVPIIGYVGRLASQKGLDLLMQVIDPLMRDFEAQFVFVGEGDGGIASGIREMQKKYPQKVGAHLMFDPDLPRLVFAGSDIMAMPSRFEPGGIVALEAMRYGAIPLVHATGGLVDSVEDYDPNTDEGYGFMFRNYDPWSLFAQIVRALETYRNKKTWRELQKRAMQQDNSWEARANEYVELYEKAIQINNRRASKGASKI